MANFGKIRTETRPLELGSCRPLVILARVISNLWKEQKIGGVEIRKGRQITPEV